MRQLTKLLSCVEGSKALRVYPELALISDVNIRNEVLKSVRKKIVFSRWGIIGIFYYCATVGVPFLLFLFYYVGFPQSQPSLLYLSCVVWFGMGGLYLIATLLFRFLIRGRKRKFVWHEIQKQGIPICVQCGYSLNGCPSDRCPECGSAVPNPSEE